MQYVHASPVVQRGTQEVQRGTQEVRKWTLAGGKTWEGTKVVAPPPPYTTLKHFWKKLKLNPKLQISIAEFYALSRYYVCRCSRNIVIRFSAVSYFWELFKKPIGTDEANTLELL